jgi:hypothetical protein
MTDQELLKKSLDISVAISTFYINIIDDLRDEIVKLKNDLKLYKIEPLALESKRPIGGEMMEDKIREFAYEKHGFMRCTANDRFIKELSELFEKEQKEFRRWWQTRYDNVTSKQQKEIAELKADNNRMKELLIKHGTI